MILKNEEEKINLLLSLMEFFEYLILDEMSTQN
jgi:hypothetical protein